MGMRNTVGSTLESIIGHERTNTIRKVETRTRNALAKKLAMERPRTTTPSAKPRSKADTGPAAPKPETAKSSPLAAERPFRATPATDDEPPHAAERAS